MRVLVLEDSSAMRRMLRHVLRDDGHDVMESEDGVVAYDQATIEITDLLIADIDLPRVNGIEAILAARHSNPDLKIIAISGGGTNGRDDYLHVCKELGASEILKKPFEPEALLGLVRGLRAELQSA